MKSKRRYRCKSRMKSNKVNYIIIFAITAMFIIGIIFIYFGFNYKDNAKSIYNYTAQRNSGYVVLLKPNNFYTSEILPSGKYYASNSIKEFQINFNYNFKGNKKTEIYYKYNVIATLSGTISGSDNVNKEVWTRDFILIDDKNSEQSNIDEFTINEKANIDYAYYNNLVNSYEDTYDINIDANLQVALNVHYNLIDNQVDDCIKLNIPITNTVTEAKEDYEKITYKDIIQEAGANSINRIIFYVIGGLLIAGAIVTIIVRIKISKTQQTPEEEYNNNINRILKYYRDLIVTVTNKPDVDNLKIMNLYKLDDLIDVAEQNRNNIIHYEAIKNERSNLYVIVDEYAYIYVVTSQELK